MGNNGRVRSAGKFLFAGTEKVYVRGVTYGTFRPDSDGVQFPDRTTVRRDFAMMCVNSINTLRTYTVPPEWLLDEAIDYGLRVMVGIPVGRYIGVLAERNGSADPTKLVAEDVRRLAGHEGVLCYSVGNEIPASTVRWHGRRKVERYLRDLYRAAKEQDPDALVTYVNYPTTEYLQLDFLDLMVFNVFLESTTALGSYVARLQNIAGDRPLVLGEVGLDSLRNGEEAQAESVGSQVRTAFSAGCAGTFVFSWTDEWHRGGNDVTDWRFGLTREDRQAKPALEKVRQVYSSVPFPDEERPKVSVVVCSYNGAERIGECLEGISQLEYKDYETIVVDNGSTDETAAVASSYPGVKVISTAPTGLGDARNVGMRAAHGKIVAYIDDDATPDPHWLTYLAESLARDEFDAVGGPNIAPHNGGLVALCVSRAPGNPVHVLLSDREAEHIAGCNMAFRKEALNGIGGFDTRYRTAGDDVDVCWRIHESGGRIGFNHAAMVWHQPRATVRGFWRQQTGYGKAEALLESKWPEKYNATGQARWAGRVYGVTAGSLLNRPSRVYHGIWGTAPFQSLYQPRGGRLASLAASPEWYLILLTLGGLSALSVLWSPLSLAIPLLVLAVGIVIGQAVRSAILVPIDETWQRPRDRLRARVVIGMLHLVQPIARMWGRVRSGLTPWRRPRPAGVTLPRTETQSFWSESWRPPEDWILDVETYLRDSDVDVFRGGSFDRFDLEARTGLMGAARMLLAVEDHAGGRQLIRTRVWPHLSAFWTVTVIALVGLALGAFLSGGWAAGAILGVAGVGFGGRSLWECRDIARQFRNAVSESRPPA